MDLDIIQEAFSQIQVMAPTPSVILAIMGVLILLIVSGFTSGSEIAFFSLSPKDMSQLNPEENITDRIIEDLRNDTERTLATILIVNNFVNVTIIMLCNYIFANTIDFGMAWWLQFLCVTVILTFLLLLFGEILPKIYSRQNALAFCRKIAGPLLIFKKIFWPFETILMSTGFLAERLTPKEHHVLSVDELEQALEMTDQDDIREEQSILKGIIRFGDETAREVMTSRQDIIDLEIHSAFDEVLKCVVDNNYSRIPVYQGNHDNIRGILYIKDLLPHLNKPANFRWQSLMRPPYFVPETKKIDDLLRDFQENKVHIAIVVDEFGGTSGIVTMEDILEEIVGEINDEFDEEENFYTKLNYNTYLFEGKTPITDLTKALKVDNEEFDEIAGEADSLAGMMLELKGDFPSLHEIMEFRNYVFEIMQLDGRRISRVKIIIRANKTTEG